MSPKLKKNVFSWHACEKCGIILATKDLQVHSNYSCAINGEANPVHGFVKESVLVNRVEELCLEGGVKYLPHSDAAYYVYLSESSMQLCGLVIGGFCFVKYPGGSAVRSVWPMYEKSLTSLMMTAEGLQFLEVEVGTRLSVERLTALPVPADIVFVRPLGDHVSSTVLSSLSKTLLGKVLLNGNKLCVRHYGQRHYFQACDIVSTQQQQQPAAGGGNDVAHRLANVHICEDGAGVSAPCFIVNAGTQFKVVDETVKHVNSLSLASVGGLEGTIQKLKEFADIVWNPKFFNLGALGGTHGCLLIGPPGSGKTLLVRALASDSGAALVEVLGSEMYSKYLGESEARLRALFAAARERAPSLLFLDEVDALCPAERSRALHEQRVAATLLAQLDSLSGAGVVVVAATSRPAALDVRLRRPGRLELELELRVPDALQRLDILRCLVGAWRGVGIEPGSLERVAQCTHGHVGADLVGVCGRALAAAVRRGEASVSQVDWDEACAQVKPSAMREVMVEVPNVRWSEVGGQHGLKLRLRQAVEWPLRHACSFERLGISPPKGVLMFGPPGCSKTMVAKALATESQLNFISIKGPELFSKWVGESERAVRDVFRRARQVAPAIVFFDELDALGGERGSSSREGGSSVQERVLAQLLTEMDGVTPLTHVTIVAATNRPDRIDKALLRPGRLDQIVYVPLPDEATRRDILTFHFNKCRFAPEVCLESVVRRTQGYSGAEVVAVCQEAGLGALEEDINSQWIEERHVERALTNVKPRTPQHLLDLYETYAIKSF
ncbi:ATPase family protein 2 homolog [Ischnura elegans]|uniref:ATPase family protein 2 homolog n=1 Tax=Ischnura elegans TaxID=197161 RepID=UPI001ED893A9|nr:ATPase family protein 2 homolog [Ischnura elegans]